MFVSLLEPQANRRMPLAYLDVFHVDSFPLTHPGPELLPEPPFDVRQYRAQPLPIRHDRRTLATTIANGNADPISVSNRIHLTLSATGDPRSTNAAFPRDLDWLQWAVGLQKATPMDQMNVVTTSVSRTSKFSLLATFQWISAALVASVGSAAIFAALTHHNVGVEYFSRNAVNPATGLQSFRWASFVAFMAGLVLTLALQISAALVLSIAARAKPPSLSLAERMVAIAGVISTALCGAVTITALTGVAQADQVVAAVHLPFDLGTIDTGDGHTGAAYLALGATLIVGAFTFAAFGALRGQVQSTRHTLLPLLLGATGIIVPVMVQMEGWTQPAAIIATSSPAGHGFWTMHERLHDPDRQVISAPPPSSQTLAAGSSADPRCSGGPACSNSTTQGTICQIVHAEDRHGRKSDKQLAHARRVVLRRGSFRTTDFSSPDSGSLCDAPVGLLTSHPA
jgi:hypothetical protein